MKKPKKFRKGQVVYSAHNAVLVSGKGYKGSTYPAFAGVVIMNINTEEESVWPLGMYSDTWRTEAFKKLDIKLSKIVADALKIR